MKNYLRILALAALFLLPMSMKAQVPIPYTNGFEGDSALVGWTYDPTTDAGLNNYAAHTGSSGYRFTYYTYPDYLITPELTGTNSGVQVEFWYKNHSSSYPETFQVGYSTTDTALSSFTWDASVTIANQTWTLYQAVYPAGTKYVCINYLSDDMFYLFIDDFSAIVPPTCLPVTSVNVDAVTESSVTISWTDEENTGASYSVYNGDTFVGISSTNSYTFTGLDANTVYTFGVVANCSATDSSIMATVDARTSCASGECMLTIVGADSYGDGWNGNAIDIYYGNDFLATFTLMSGTSHNEQLWCLGSNVPLSFVWVDGMYSEEASFGIYGNTEELLYTATGSNLTDGLFGTMTDACSGTFSAIDDTDTAGDTLTLVLDVANPNMGSITPAPGTYQYQYGDNDSVFLYANPDTGFYFEGWAYSYTFEGETYFDTVYGVAYNPLNIVVDDWFGVSTMTFTALFTVNAPNTYSIATSCDSTMGYVYGGGEYIDGDIFTVTAVPYDGFHFVEWLVYSVNDGDTTFFGSTESNPLSYYSDDNYLCVAVFEADLVCNSTSCDIIINGYDSYGDGWNGGSLSLMQNGQIVGSMAVEDSMATQSFTVCNDYPVDLVWNSGNWGEEVSFTIYSATGASLYSTNSAITFVSGNTFAVINNVCTNPTVVENHDTAVVTIAVNDATMGTTTPAPGTYYYLDSDTLLLEAVANDGYVFDHWTVTYTYQGTVETFDDDTPQLGFYGSTLAANSPLTFTAYFAVETIDTNVNYYTITATCDSTMGYVTGGGVYSENDYTFTVTAYPYAGYHFVMWQVYDEDGEYLGYATENPFEYYVEANYTCVAIFEADPTPVECAGTSCTITIDGYDSYGDGWNGGSLNLVQNGQTVGYMAVEDSMASQSFTVCNDYPVDLVWNSGSWDGEVSFAIYSATGASIYSTNSAVAFVSGNTFAVISNVCTNPTVVEYHDTAVVTIAVNDSTMGTTTPATGTYYYLDSDTLLLEAVANDGYVFDHWVVTYTYDSVVNTFETSNQELAYLGVTLAYNSPLTFTAYFAAHTIDTVVFSLSVNDSTMGSITPAPGTYTYTSEDIVTITATPTAGYVFQGWQLNYVYMGESYSTMYSSVNPFIMNVENWVGLDMLNFTAVFGEAQYYTITATCDSTMGYVTGGGLYSDEDETFVVTAYPYEGYHFVMWQVYDEDGEYLGYATENPFEYYVDANYTCVAIFEADPTPIACAGTSCTITIDGYDSYGDGWNGGALYLMQNDTVVGYMSVGDSAATQSFSVCDAYPVDFVWNSGEYDSEVSFSINSPTGVSIYNVTNAGNLVDGGVFATVSNVCTNPTVVENHDTITVTIAVNDATMGTTTPAPGTYTYLDNEILSLEAVPADGFFFDYWVVDFSYMGMAVQDTLDDPMIQFQMSYLTQFAPLTFTAYFSGTPSYEITDTVTCIYAVNDATMGTTNPAPGTYTYYTGQVLHCVAVPNEGYHLAGWMVNVTVGDETLLDTVLNLPFEDFFGLFGGWTVEQGENGYVWSITAIFEGGEAPYVPADSVAITYAVNNADWGTINPAPGTYYYAVGDVFSVSATPAEGHELVGWVYSVMYYGVEIQSDTIMEPIAEFGDTVVDEMLGFSFVLTALFDGPATDGIDGIDADNVKVYSTDSKVIVRGAEGQRVVLYDVSGRVLENRQNATDNVEFNVNNSGVYLVKVGKAAARRVVVIR